MHVVHKKHGSIGHTAQSQHGGFKDGSGFGDKGMTQHAGPVVPRRKGRGRGRKRMH